MEKAAQAQELVEEMKRRLENPNLYLSIRYRQNSITHLNYLQLSVEAEAAERENQSLKGSDKATEESEDFGSFTLMNMKSTRVKTKAARADEFIRRSEPSNMSITSENTYEIQILKKELGIATVKNGEMRARSEQAATRAEKAKTISKINERGVKNKRRG
ncbi:hypothetical protein OIU85_010056 [Salix viminalis]|uniref:Uncharacterized protein n=1 Tax=Salix viminalis TaxID=40686 RepID=A0A9Q0NVU4_SALVM|nr:hypothetical protein OIU85_010056 [Salix viminalis]